MSRDHRWSKRKDVDMRVILHSTHASSIGGKILNVSLEGMLIQADEDRFPENTEIEISFEIPHKKQSNLRMRAHIVHKGLHGMGLMLKHLCHADIRTMQQLVAA